jgi:hypothetical protein
MYIYINIIIFPTLAYCVAALLVECTIHLAICFGVTPVFSQSLGSLIEHGTVTIASVERHDVIWSIPCFGNWIWSTWPAFGLVMVMCMPVLALGVVGDVVDVADVSLDLMLKFRWTSEWLGVVGASRTDHHGHLPKTKHMYVGALTRT